MSDPVPVNQGDIAGQALSDQTSHEQHGVEQQIALG